MNMRRVVGERIRQARSLAGMRSAMDLAEKIDINHKTIYLYEAGTRLPNAEVIASIAKATNTDPSWLIGFTDKENSPSSVASTCEAPIAFNSEFLGALGLKAEDTTFMSVSGDNMAPTLKEGDQVLVDKTKQQPADGIFAIKSGDETLFRRLQKNLNGSFKVLCDNKEYPADTLTAEEATSLEALGKVVWFGRKL